MSDDVVPMTSTNELIAKLADYPYFDTLEQAERYMEALCQHDGRPRRVHKSRSLNAFFVLLAPPPGPSQRQFSKQKHPCAVSVPAKSKAESSPTKPRTARERAAKKAKEHGIEFICWLCEYPIVIFEALHPYGYSEDHIIPRSKGGKRDADNLMPAHRLCNVLRGDGDATDSIKNLCKYRYDLHHKP